MKARVIQTFALLLAARYTALGDMAAPSPTPAGTGGVSFEMHDIHRSLTPFGWVLLVLFITAVVILLGRGLLSLRKRRRGL